MEKNIIEIKEIVKLKEKEKLDKILSLQDFADLKEAKINATSFFKYLKKISRSISENDQIRQEIDISFLIKFTVEKNKELDVQRYIRELREKINNSRKI